MSVGARRAALREALQRRIVLLDGGMGTEIQKHKLKEEDFRGSVLQGTHTICEATTTCWC
ncbi:MAG: hypothetical protein LR015_12685 [Verrucomicrobia bacterium]|nr:hypothetical protein [Verrucomicrobiota bacterium]